MSIDRAELFLVPLRLRDPFETSAGSTRDRAILLVALQGDGVVGWGECVAGVASGYSAETTESGWAALTETLLPDVVARDWTARRAGVREDRPALPVRIPPSPNPMARAAVEMALWDLDAKLRGVPLCEALGGSRRPVETGIALGIQPDDATLHAKIGAALAEGYRRVKLKVEPGHDVATIRSARERFPDAPLMVDANGAYRVDDLATLRALDELGLLMIEQPLPARDLEGHAYVQSHLATPICLDESISTVEDAARALDLGSCRVVNLKPGRVGGLDAALEIHALCTARRVPLWCGGMLESGVGRAHNVALATLPGFTLPGDLSPSRRYWERDLVDPEWRMVAGALKPLDAPGIGVEPDLARIRTLAVRRATVSGDR